MSTEKGLIFEIYATTALSYILHWDLNTVDFKFSTEFTKATYPETYLVPSRTFKMKPYVKTCNFPCENIRSIIVTTFVVWINENRLCFTHNELVDILHKWLCVSIWDIGYFPWDLVFSWSCTDEYLTNLLKVIVG